MNVPIFQVDVFTAKPFAGNPAAVCILPQPMDEQWMQNVAREMNLSGGIASIRTNWLPTRLLPGGVIKIRLMGSRVVLGGQAITVLRGDMF